MLLCLTQPYSAANEIGPPDAPSGLTLSYGDIGGGENGLLIGWTDNSDNETGFQLQWAVQTAHPGFGEWDELADVLPGTVTYDYDDGALSGHSGSLVGQTVWVRVRAYTRTAVSTWVTGSLLVTAPGSDFSDNFNRAGGSGLGSPWVDVTGAWDITGNRAELVTPDGTAYDLAIVPLGANGTWQVSVPTLDSVASGLCFRQSDASNFWVFVENGAGCELRKIVAGSTSVVGSNGATGVLSVQATGSAIECFVGGVSVITTTDAFNDTAIGGGLAAEPSGGGSGARWDDFSYVH